MAVLWALGPTKTYLIQIVGVGDHAGRDQVLAVRFGTRAAEHGGLAVAPLEELGLPCSQSTRARFLQSALGSQFIFGGLIDWTSELLSIAGPLACMGARRWPGTDFYIGECAHRYEA